MIGLLMSRISKMAFMLKLCHKRGVSIQALISIGLSAISHRFFEQPFLNLKKSFSLITTGDNVK